MASSLRNDRKRSTWSIAFYLLILFVGSMLVEGARVPLSDNGNAVSEPVIGIQLGSSYSRAGTMRDGKFEIITNDQGSRITPSWPAFINERLVGETADNQAPVNPRRSIFDFKRLIGGQPRLDIKIQEAEDVIKLEETSARILGKLKQDAETYLSQAVENAVIAVPAYYNDAQRAATRKAGSIAGLDVLRVINEPTAAALAYGLDITNQTEFQIVGFGLDKISPERHVLVYDLGAGTLDVSIVTVEEGVLEIWATAGDKHLGGNDFNGLVVNHLAEKYNRDNDVDITQDPETMDKLQTEVEKVKCLLSSQQSAMIEIESFYRGNHFSETLTRAQFEALNDDLFKKSFRSIEQALKEAKIKKSDIDDIVFSGGSTHIPKIQQLLEEYFDKKAHKDIDPEEVVAMGAAIQGSVILNPPYEGCVYPLDAMALLSLGIETTDGCTTHVINRGTTLPTRKSRIFSTTADNQTVFPIKVIEGQRPRTADNYKLAELQLPIPPAPRGTTQIEITFELDINHNLKVSALAPQSSNRASTTIINEDRFSEAYILGALDEAEEHDTEDQAVRARCEARARLEEYVYSLKRQVRDSGVGEDRALVVAVVAGVEEWLDGRVGADVDAAVAGDFDRRFRELCDVVEPVGLEVGWRGWWGWVCGWCWWCCGWGLFGCGY